MKYLVSKRRRLTGLGIGKDTRGMVSFLSDRGYFKSFFIFIKGICRYLHDKGKVDKCPFIRNLGFTEGNTPQCLCSSCYGWRKLLYNKDSSYIANRLYSLYTESLAEERGDGSIDNDSAMGMLKLKGIEISLGRRISCIESYITLNAFDEDKIHDCHRNCMERSYEIPD